MSGSGFVGGVLIGALLVTVIAVAIRDQGREECEKNILRSEKCVQTWVPEKEAAKGKKGDAA
ncbi:hypothetical protein [Delftia acidovorans]|uniref:Uncharacterized protein n=1 Tax=Delftia acidovorans TaxID=80866 RepID=A0AAJ2R7S5_DELAC|nr:hypothetical protein [Delftia acidovorans]MDX4957249.1 hypothetical protein [Delftia acidovorans]